MAIYTRTGDKGETGLLGGDRVSKGSLHMGVIGTVDELNSILGFVVAMADNLRRNMDSNDAELHKIVLGLAKLTGQLRDIQRELFEIGAELAKLYFEKGTEVGVSKQDNNLEYLEPRNLEAKHMARMAEEFLGSKQVKHEMSDFSKKEESTKLSLDVIDLEVSIDEMERELPPLKNFVLPGGGVIGAQLMMARAICRRSERELVRYIKSNIKNQKSSMQINNQKNVHSISFDNWKLETGNHETTVSYFNRLSDYLFVAGRWVNWLMKEEEIIWRPR